MPLRPVILERFGGLSLRSDVAEVGGTAAIDMTNVTLDRDGRVRARDGFSSYTAGTTTDVRHGYMFATPADKDVFLCQYDTSSAGKVAAFDRTSLTTPLDTEAFGTASANITGYQAIGTPSASLVFISTSSREIIKWDGSAFSTVTQAGRLIALSPQDNRLVAADTASGETSRVRFSDPGAPETFATNNYVELTPGDGEQFVAVVSWREFVFVFKESRFFVFYGNDTDNAGNPIFNYRTVDGIGAMGTTGNQSVAIGRDGVYFVSRDGMYRTNGGQATRVSDAVTPWFNGTEQPYFMGAANTQSDDVFTAAVGDRIYFSRPPASGHLLWGLDTTTGNWEYWAPALGASPLDGIGWLRDTADDQVLAVSTLAAIRTLDAAATTDAAAYTSSYRTGFLDFGDPSPKDIKGMLLDGVGTATVSCSVNSATAVPAGSAVTLGSTPSIGRGQMQQSNSGHNFSFTFALASGASVSRAVVLMQSGKAAGAEN